MLTSIHYPKFRIIQVQCKRESYISINTKPFSTSAIRLDPSRNTNENNLSPELVTIVQRHDHFGQEYGHDVQTARAMDAQLMASNDTNYLDDRLQQVNDDIDALRNVHHDMENRDQHLFVADTRRETIIDRLIEIRGEAYTNGTIDDTSNSDHQNDNNDNNDNNNNDNNPFHHHEISSPLDEMEVSRLLSLDIPLYDVISHDVILYLYGYIKCIFFAYSIHRICKKNGIYLTLHARFVTLYKSIYNKPKPYKKSTFLLKSELLSLFDNYNSAINMLSVFNVKSKKDSTQKTKLEKNNNFVGKYRHYPPANKE